MNPSEIPNMPDWLRGSEMGELIFAHDWAESGLGPIASMAAKSSACSQHYPSAALGGITAMGPEADTDL